MIISRFEIFKPRAHVMRVAPHVLRAAFCSAVGGACGETVSGFRAGEITRQERAWKLLLLSRMLLYRPRREGLDPKQELEQRLTSLSRRELAGVDCTQQQHGPAICDPGTLATWRALTHHQRRSPL